MKDPLFNSLAERFADHTMDVDPGTWSAISGKLAAASGSSLSGLLQEKFAGHEAPVDPQVWTNISSQLGHGAAAGVGSTAGWWAAGIAATLVAAGVVVYNVGGGSNTPALSEKAPVVAPALTEPVAASTQLSAVADQQPMATEATAPSTATRNEASSPVSGRSESHMTQGANGTTGQGTPANIDEPKSRNLPPPTQEGEQAVAVVLQDIVDNYVTSPVVVAHEPKVPAPTQDEMPSSTVHPYHEDAEAEPEPETVEEQGSSAPEVTVFIPTAFSPNGDFVNDELAVSVQHYQKATVRIFSATSDRLVFSADNLETRWNGLMMNSGDRCEPGMYFYALEVTDAQGRTWSKGEVVRLFR